MILGRLRDDFGKTLGLLWDEIRMILGVQVLLAFEQPLRGVQVLLAFKQPLRGCKSCTLTTGVRQARGGAVLGPFEIRKLLPR